ncbi:MAG: hypothetical protein AABY93_16550 [Bacteroidota bacterium]
MNKLVFIFLLVCVGCKDEDPGLSSPEGKWAYTTPDNKIAVTFEVIKTPSGDFDIQNQTMKINGVATNAEKEVVGFTATSFEKIRINANDALAVYPFNIVFDDGKLSGDFMSITVPTATYTYPWGTTNSLADITIQRF